jgi:hypothetical protein
MMRWLLQDTPALERVTTITASDNAYMIRVNEQLGHTHYADIGFFEATVEQVAAALGVSRPFPRRAKNRCLKTSRSPRPCLQS